MRKDRGIAILMAVASLSLILAMVMDIAYESMLEYTIHSQKLSRVQAYYAAKSAMDLSLLRIKMYQKLKQSLGKNAGPFEKYLSMVWQYPLAWPLPIPESLTGTDRSSYNQIKKDSLMEAQYTAFIEDEGSKIDVNDLVAKSESLRKITYAQILNILNAKLESDETFDDKYNLSDFENLLGNMIDWMSDKNESSRGGGSKKSHFSELNATAPSELYPPNRPFRTLNEIRMTPGMTDEIFEVLKDKITIYGLRGINPNTASLEVIQGIDPGINEKVVTEVDKQRKEAPFTSAKEFWDFLDSLGVKLNVNPDDVPLTFESVANFKIQTLGISGAATREITAIVVNLDATANQIQTFLDKDKKTNQREDSQKNPPPGGATPGGAPQTPSPGTQAKSEPIPKGPPRVVFWSER